MKKYELEFYKVIVSIIFGVICFISAKYPIVIDRAYDVYITISLMLPIIISLAWGWRYAIISTFLGLVFFIPFQMTPKNGFANIATGVMYCILLIGHGYCSDKIKDKKIPFYSTYIMQLIFILIYISMDSLLVQNLAKLNPIFWRIGYADQYIPTNIIKVNTSTTAMFATVFVLFANSLLSIPYVKKIFKINIDCESKNNTYIFWGMILVTITIFIADAKCAQYSMTYFGVSVDIFKISIGNAQKFSFVTAVIFLLGDFLIHIYEYNNQIQISEKISKERYLHIFEACDDLIWTINSGNFNIINANISARNYFRQKRKIEILENMKIEEMFFKEDKTIWKEFYESTIKKGRITVEYVDEYNDKIFEVRLFLVNFGDKRNDISVFLKDVTEAKKVSQKIEMLNKELESRVIERTKELQCAYNELESFSYTVSHELKTPIRAIETYGNILKEDNWKYMDEDGKEAIDGILHYCRNAQALIIKILEYSKVKTRKFKYEIIDMNDLVNEVYNELKLINSNQKIDFQKCLLPTIKADSFLMRQVVYNILSNAIKFSSNRNKIKIQIRYDFKENNHIFHFKDNGIGFDEKYSKKLFSLFNRIHSSQEFEGAGLGLVIIKKIMEEHGGDVVMSSKENKGCLISINIPQ